MRKTKYLSLVLLAVLACVSVAVADGLSIERSLFARLSSFEEVPALVSPATGWMRAETDLEPLTINYTLGYKNLQSDVTQIHIHIGQKGAVGGVAVFLCSNLGNGPAGVQPCPTNNGEITGAIKEADVLGSAAAQGVGVGEIHRLFQAIRGGAAYINVHTVDQPSGAIRGQVMTRLTRSLLRPKPLGR